MAFKCDVCSKEFAQEQDVLRACGILEACIKKISVNAMYTIKSFQEKII